jgi:ATP-binding cassette, subfamily C (CFTR/MRP), member 2
LHYRIPPNETSELNYRKLRKKWRVYDEISKRDRNFIKKRGNVFLKVLYSAFNGPLWICFWISLFFSCLEFAKTFVMYQSLKNFKKAQDDISPHALYINIGILVGGLAICQLIFACLNAVLGMYTNLVSQRFSASVRCLIFEKLLRKSFEREQLLTMGELTNIINSDTSNLEDITDLACGIFKIPLEIIIGVVGMYMLMGMATFAALAVLSLTIIINWGYSKAYGRHKQKYNEKKDSRTNVIVELFENIKFIKLNSLESDFVSNVLKKKEDEIRYIKKLIERYIFSSALNELGPAMFLISLNGFNLWLTGTLSLEKAFTSALILNIFRRNFRDLPDLMVSIVDIYVSCQRISYYLFSEEIDKSFIQYMCPMEVAYRGTESDRKYGLMLRKGNFYWKDEEVKQFYEAEKQKAFKKKKSKAEKKLKKLKKTRAEKRNKGEDINQSLEEDIMLQEKLLNNEDNPVIKIDMTLSNINMNLPRGTCSALIGKVSSGKSSLLCAMLGEMYFKPGASLRIDKKIAYVSQQSWTLSKTIKDNIVMGHHFDEKRFKDALTYSCFLEDLNDMPSRELTVIGNKGINLSGGQKARLAIARALYSDADVYLFDDPISALDINVGKKVMENGILGYLKGKTVLVATHALAYLPYFHNIYVMDEGKIVLEGNYDKLLSSDKFKDIYKDLELDNEKQEEDSKRKEGGEIGATKSKQDVSVQNLDIYEVPNREQEPIGPLTLKVERSANRIKSRLSRRNSDTSIISNRMVLMDDRIVNDAINIEDKAKGAIKMSVVMSYFKMIGGMKFVIMTLRNICFT